MRASQAQNCDLAHTQTCDRTTLSPVWEYTASISSLPRVYCTAIPATEEHASARFPASSPGIGVRVGPVLSVKLYVWAHIEEEKNGGEPTQPYTQTLQCTA